MIALLTKPSKRPPRTHPTMIPARADSDSCTLLELAAALEVALIFGIGVTVGVAVSRLPSMSPGDRSSGMPGAVAAGAVAAVIVCGAASTAVAIKIAATSSTGRVRGIAFVERVNESDVENTECTPFHVY